MSNYKKRETDFTQGNISKLLIMFFLPLLFGNLFQQLYNTVDTWVLGNYVSNEAFSAVGAVAPILNIFIGIFTGLSGGATVTIANYYGQHNNLMVRKSVKTSFTLTLILAVIFTALGLFLIP